MARATIAAIVLTLATVTAGPSLAQPAQPPGKDVSPAKVDALGDPLPEGALMRLGSHRLYSGGSGGSALKLSADGSLVAWAGPNRHMCVYRVKDGKALLAVDRGPQKSKYIHVLNALVELSPDGKYLATQTRVENTVRVYEIASGKEIFNTQVEKQATVLAFAPDGKRLAVGSDQGQVHVFDVPAGKGVVTFKGEPAQVWCLLFGRNGKTLWCGDQNNIVEWNLETKKQLTVLKGHSGVVFALALAADGKTLYSGSQDHTIRLWDLTVDQEIKALKGHDDGDDVRGVHHLSLVAGGRKLLSVAGDRTVRLWNLDTGENEVKFKTPETPFLSFTLSANGKVAAQHKGQFIELLDVASGKSLVTAPGHRSQVRSVAWTADGKHAATAGLDDTVRVWDPATGKQKHRFPGSEYPYGTLAFLPDNKTLLASGCNDPQIHFWDITTGKKVKSLQRMAPEINYKNSFFFSGTFAVSPNGKLIASASANPEGGPGAPFLTVTDVATGKPIRTLAGLPGKGFNHGGCVAFSPDSKSVVVGASAGSNYVEAESGNHITHLLMHASAVAVSPKNDRIAILGNGGILSMFDPKTGKQLYTVYSPNEGGTGSVLAHALAFSPDGRYVATAGGSLILLRDPKTGKVLRELRGHLDVVHALAFSADGQRLLSGSDDGTALTWDVREKKAKEAK